MRRISAITLFFFFLIFGASLYEACHNRIGVSLPGEGRHAGFVSVLPSGNLSTGIPFSGFTDETRMQPPDILKLTGIREKFIYEVRYGVFRLGNVTVTTLRDTTHNGTDAWYFSNLIESNRRLPLVGHRVKHYHSIFTHNDSIPYGLLFWVDSIHDEVPDEFRYDFDYENGKVYSFEEGQPVDTLDLDGYADSGPVLFYFSRLFAGTDAELAYPIYIDHDEGKVEMNFSSRIHSFRSNAFPGETLPAYSMSGNADFEGPFGFSGRFEAVFRADSLRIPLQARLQVWIGRVRVDLVEYKRL